MDNSTTHPTRLRLVPLAAASEMLVAFGEAYSLAQADAFFEPGATGEHHKTLAFHVRQLLRELTGEDPSADAVNLVLPSSQAHE